MNPKRSTSSQTLLGLGILFLLVGLGGSYEFLAPRLLTARTDLATSQAQLDTITSEVAQLNVAQQNLVVAKQSLTNRGIDLNKALEVMPATENVPGLYIQLEDLMTRGGQAGVSETNYQVSDPIIDTDGTAKVPVTITGFGSYSDLKNFITMAETNIRPLSFTTVGFAAAQKNGGTVLQLTATGYVRSQGLSAAFSSK